jgi:hypothetical protein
MLLCNAQPIRISQSYFLKIKTVEKSVHIVSLSLYDKIIWKLIASSMNCNQL